MHGAVDLLVVGWFGDATNLSAVFTGSNLVQMATMLIAGLTMGATVLIGRYIGENNPKRAGKAVGAASCMFAVVAVMISLLMVIFALINIRMEAILLFVAAYLFVAGYGIYWRFKYEREM